MGLEGLINVPKCGENQDKNVPVILAVEDDEDNQLLLKHTVTMFGWKYLFATNALATISIAKTQQPSLILLDIVLPQISGIQIARMLKSCRKTSRIPLIAVTGLATEQQQKLIFAAGFNDYVCKPFNLDDLQRSISANLKPIPYCEIVPPSDLRGDFL